MLLQSKYILLKYQNLFRINANGLARMFGSEFEDKVL